MDLTIVVVNYHTDVLLRRFLNSLATYEPKCSYEVIVVNVESSTIANAATDHLQNVKFITFEDNVGYAKSCNAAARMATGRNIAFFNADTAFKNSECVDICSEYLDEHPDVGAVGPLQTSSTGYVTHAGITGTNRQRIDRGWKSRSPQKYSDTIDCISISGSAYFTRMSTWLEMRECPTYQTIVPLAEGAFLPTQLYFEETWYSYHLRGHGYRVVYLGHATMIHEWHKSSPVGSQSRKIREAGEQFKLACDLHGLER
jgi:GT2 family glycosyltransferase